MFWCVCGNVLTVSHNTPICTNFFYRCSTSIINCGKRVWSMLFSLVLYMILVSVVSAALFHVLVHHIEETVATALLFYIRPIVMNWWFFSGLVSLLTFQTKNLPATDNGSRSVLSCQSVMKVPKCIYCLNCPEFDELVLRKIVRIIATRCQILG